MDLFIPTSKEKRKNLIVKKIWTSGLILLSIVAAILILAFIPHTC